MIPIRIEEKEVSAPRDSRNCYFCHSRESEDDAWWRLGNYMDYELIWICFSCLTIDNVQGWLNNKKEEVLK